MKQKNIEFLLCFDKNYLNQGFSAILSLLLNVDKEIDIHIIHNVEKIESLIPDAIDSNINLKSINFYQVRKDYNFFPNIENKHVSEATYFRLFASELLSKEIKFLTYLDADTICVSNPMKELENMFELMQKEKFIISAKTEEEKSKIVDFYSKHMNSYEIPFARLPISEKYFNAGVMCINFEDWLNQGISEKLFENLEKYSKDLVNWDQDVLNITFNGNYSELNKELNQYDTEIYNKKDLANTKFIHFVGSKKPWNPTSKIKPISMSYHNIYRKFNDEYFHIKHIWRKKSIIYLLNSIFNFSIFNLDKPFTYSYQFVKSLKKKI